VLARLFVFLGNDDVQCLVTIAALGCHMRTAISIEDDTASMIENAPRREKFRWVKERLWANQFAVMQLLVLSYRHREVGEVRYGTVGTGRGNTVRKFASCVVDFAVRRDRVMTRRLA
jgi:hypothetical protein